MNIPVIDFARFSDQPEMVADAVSRAAAEIGFMGVKNLGIDQAMLEAVYEASAEFFAQPSAIKQQSGYTKASDNFGFLGINNESLDPATPPDKKETFTMRAPYRYGVEDPRWPSAEFRELMIGFYQHCMARAFHLLQAFCQALELPEDFFQRRISGENTSLRLLYYPGDTAGELLPQQLGAGAHTDYGVITLLFQDDAGGLEVRDSSGRWVPVEPEEGLIIINTGDLMERWTNGRYRSTEHRVQPRTAHSPRFSIAFFVDPDNDVLVEALPSCLHGQPARYPPVTVEQHLMEKLQATHHGIASSS